MDRLQKEIKHNSQRIRELYNDINTAIKKNPGSIEHHKACSAFHDSFDKLSFPGGWRYSLEQLKCGNAVKVKEAIVFLEVDEIFFRSGYMKEDILRHLKHVELTEGQKQRLVSRAIRSMHSGGRREAKLYARLTVKFNDQKLISHVLSTLKIDKFPEVKRRAQYFHKLMEMHKKTIK